MEETTPSTKPKSALDLAFDKFQEDTEECRFIRKSMIEQLRRDLPKAQVADGDKAMMIQAKMSVISTLNGLLKDVESAAAGRVKLRLSMSEQENAGQYSKSIAALLKMISVADVPRNDGTAPETSDSDIQDALAKRGEDLKIEISEGELEACGGAPGEPQKKPENTEEPEKTE